MTKLLFIALALMAVAAPLASVACADYAIDKTIQAP
jgi:hypothetical protein